MDYFFHHLKQRLYIASKLTVKWFFSPLRGVKSQRKVTEFVSKQAKSQEYWGWLWTKDGKDVHLSIQRRLYTLKYQTSFGNYWEAWTIILSLIACVLYVVESYYLTFESVAIYNIIEIFITQFFAMDFILNLIIAPKIWFHLLSMWTFIDILTILPIYLSLIVEKYRVNLGVLRFVRILRLVRVLRTFRLIQGMTGIKRQIVSIFLTLACMLFLGAGIVQILENDIRGRISFDCLYINSHTNWQPSCSKHLPESSLPDCDCRARNCMAIYQSSDSKGHPTGLNCVTYTFLEAFFVCVYTVSLIGYGGLSRTPFSQIGSMIFIIFSLVFIPMQINNLSVMLSAHSIYRDPYNPDAFQKDAHVIICGATSDYRRLERILRELTHPDRQNGPNVEFNVVILSPAEPSDSLKALLLNSKFDGCTKYVMGSVLNVEDLRKARADIATGILFLCDSENSSSSSRSAVEDTAVILLQTLSVNNFNPNVQVMVQVFRAEDRDVLKDGDASVVLCLDEYRTVLQARNCTCPGIATLIENLFHTFGAVNISTSPQDMPVWLEEYSYGCEMEVYHIPLPHAYVAALSFEWALIAEGIFLEFDFMLIGVCSTSDSSVVINPIATETVSFKYPSKFFAKYNIGILVAPNQDAATYVASSLMDPSVISGICRKLVLAEEQLRVRYRKNKPKTGHDKKLGVEASRVALMKDIIRVSKLRSDMANAEGNAGAMLDDDGLGVDDFVGFVQVAATKPDVVKRRQSFKLSRSSFRQSIASMDVKMDEEQKAKQEKEKDSDADQSGDDSALVAPAPRLRYQDSFNTQKSFARRTHMVAGMGSQSAAMTDLLKLQEQYLEKEIFQEDLRLLSSSNGMTYDQESKEVEDASDLKYHIIVFGCMENIAVFVAELRKPLMVNDAYHSIVIVHEDEPEHWHDISDLYSDVYFIRAKLTAAAGFNKANIRDAFALCLLADRNGVTQVEGENLDAEALFAYLKLEKYIPRHLFFTTELTVASNMAVLNTTIVSKAKGTEKYGLVRLKSDVEPSDLNRRRLSSVSTGSLAAIVTNTKSHRVQGAFCTHGMLREHNTGGQQTLKKRNSSKTLDSVEVKKSKRIQWNLWKGFTRVNKRGKSKVKKNSSALGRRGSDSTIAKGDNNRGTDPVARVTDPSSFWKIDDTHHALPVFASGRAFVASSFDSLICQSLFSSFSTAVAEKLACGQKFQTLYQINVPSNFVNRTFVDLYRALLSRNLYVIGIYRAPCIKDGSCLPFVYTCPVPNTTLRLRDRVFIWASPIELLSAMKTSLNLPLLHLVDGSIAVVDNITERQPIVTVAQKRAKHKAINLRDVGRKVLSTISLRKSSLKPGSVVPSG